MRPPANRPAGRPEARRGLTVPETALRQSNVLCERSLRPLHSSGRVSCHLRGCRSSPGRGRHQLSLAVWAERGQASAACLGLSGGNRGAAAVAGSHRLESGSQEGGRQKDPWSSGTSSFQKCAHFLKEILKSMCSAGFPSSTFQQIPLQRLSLHLRIYRRTRTHYTRKRCSGG